MADITKKMLHGFSAITSTMTYPVDQHYDGGRTITHENLLDSTANSEDSADSGASSPLEFMDDASTSSSLSPSQTVSDGPLYKLASLMVSLPIKRGLSKYFEGKSQSFTSLSSVSSIEDLAKREIPLRKRVKSCKRCASGLDGSRSSTLGTSRRTITKKPVRGSGSCLPAKINCSFVVGRSPHSTK